MSVAEFAPQIPTPEQLPSADIQNEVIPPVDVQESQLATQGLSKEVRKQQSKLEKREKANEFYQKLGEITVKIAASGPVEDGKPTPYDELKALSPQTFLQRRAAAKRVQKAERIAQEKRNLEDKMKLYPITGGSSRISLLKTAKARLDAYTEAKKQLAQPGPEGIDLKTYQKKKQAIGGKYVYAGQLNQEKINKKHDKAVKKFANKLVPLVMNEVRQSRVNSAQRKLDELKGVGPYDQLADTLLAQAPTEQVPTPEETPVEEPVVIIPPAPKRSGVERLREARAAHKAAVPEGSYPKVEVEPAVIPEATPTPAKPEAPVAEPTPIEKLAEIAYLSAKEEIFRQIDEEDEKRRIEGKPALTKDEKSAIWAKERDVRRNIVSAIEDSTRRQQVNEQIGKLMAADKEARKKGEEQLLQRRRREKRETAAPARRETVQQRARRERQEKQAREREAAARVNRNAQQTAIDS